MVGPEKLRAAGCRMDGNGFRQKAAEFPCPWWFRSNIRAALNRGGFALQKLDRSGFGRHNL
jgi:hypothetical protein